MKRIYARTALAGLIAIAVLLFVAGLSAIDSSLNGLLWLLWGAVITLLVMALTFVISWMDYDDARSKEAKDNVRSFGDRRAS